MLPQAVVTGFALQRPGRVGSEEVLLHVVEAGGTAALEDEGWARTHFVISATAARNSSSNLFASVMRLTIRFHPSFISMPREA